MLKAQVIDVLDRLEVILPKETQIVLEVDHSSGHAKFREDCLHVPSMSLKWGGKQRKMRDTKITAGCDGREYEEEVVDVGYVGAAQGIKLVSWERGLWKQDMPMSNESADMNAATVLANSPDFKREKGALQTFVESRGRILLISPKFHPEVAGVGIEYSWGKSKQIYRREIHDGIPKNLHSNIVRSMCGENVLTLDLVRRFARRSRDYCRAYFTLDKLGVIDSKGMIGKIRKVSKAHRNIVDIDPAFINNQ
ncbi:unnamed protein product [Sphacelaria rigidula]